MRRIYLTLCCLFLAACVAAPVRQTLVLDQEGQRILARIYDMNTLAKTLESYGASVDAEAAQVLQHCSIAYAIVRRTQAGSAEQAQQLQALHGSIFYDMDENRCAEQWLASRWQSRQWQRIEQGDWPADEVLFLERFDTAFERFNGWASQVCPERAEPVSAVYRAVVARVQRQAADIRRLQTHYQDAARAQRVLSWYDGRREADYHTLAVEAEHWGRECRPPSKVPRYRELISP